MISNGFAANIALGNSIKIIIGLITNPPDQTNTNSLTLMAYTDNTFNYQID